MRQTWEEHEPNHEAFLAYLAATEAGFTPQSEVVKWRKRFWCAFAVACGLATLVLMRDGL